MRINISKVLVKYLKENILDLSECYLYLGDVFYFNSIRTEKAKPFF